MIRILLLPLLTFGVCRGYCQMTPQDYFMKGRNEREMGHNSAALAAFRYILQKHPTSPLCPGVHYYIAGIYADEKKNVDAIKEYRMVVADTAEDAIILSQNSFFPPDLKHSSADILSSLYEQMGMYDSALYFLGLSDTVFRTQIWGCGNAADGEETFKLLRYAKIQEEGSRIKDAEQTLLTGKVFCLNSGSNELIKKLSELLKKYEDHRALKSEIDKAVEHFYFDTGTYRYSTKDTFVHCCINFLGQKVKFEYKGLNFWGKCTQPLYSDRTHLIALLKETALYVMVKEL